MNDEIKEILENIKCPQLGYDEYGKWGALPLNVRMTLKRLCDYVVSCDDYITNLQQENEYLKKNQRFHKKFGNDYIFCLEGDKATYRDLIFVLQERIDKAIEYIKENDKFSNLSGIYEFYGDIDELLRILKGDDENEK